MKLKCWLRGIWYRYWYHYDYPVSGCSVQEQDDGSIVCADCGDVLYASKVERDAP